MLESHTPVSSASPVTEPVSDPTRRAFFKMGIMAGGLLAVPAFVHPAFAGVVTYRAAFRNAHTGESFSGVYRIGDSYLPEAFKRIDYVLRDFRQNEVYPIDPRLMDMLYFLGQQTGGRTPFEVVSGYRSPRTNARLRQVSSGVARNSYHMKGKALDFRLAGTSTARIRRLALDMKAGGVGYYPSSNFVHIDTGPVRSW